MNNIKTARKAKGLTQVELAQKVGVTQGNLSAWEPGRWEPEMDALKKLCEVLECSADFLLGQEALAKNAGSVNNIYFHLAKEMEEMQLPEEDIAKILEFARYMKEKNDKIGK